MPSETNKVKPDRSSGETRRRALGVGEPGARPGPSAGAGKAPALICSDCERVALETGGVNARCLMHT